MEGNENSISKWQGLPYVIIGILVFGSLWGLAEVVIGGGLATTSFPYRAGLLTGIGIAIMGIALALHKKPVMLIGIGLMAVLVKLLAVPILHISVMCKANSAIAVFTESVALALVASLFIGALSKSIHARMGTGALAAIIAAVGFCFIGIHAAPCNYLLSFTPGGFIITEGLIWAAFSACLLPPAYLLGEKLALKTSLVTTRRPLYYATSAVVICLCWGISAIAIMAGL